MKPFTNHILPIVSSIILFASVPALYAWTGPVGTPPANNVSAPINISDKSQNKLGALGLGGLAVFGKTLLTEVSGYTLPTATKPTMLLGVNGAVGAKEYCDENGTNCVSTLGGSGGSGAGWENVSLNNNDDFNDSCMYRFRMGDMGYLYPSAVYPKVLYWNISEDGTQIHYILSTDKYSQRYKVVSNFGQASGGSQIAAITKIEKSCGGSSTGSAGNSNSQIFPGWPNALVCNSTTGNKKILRADGYYPNGLQNYSSKAGYIYGEIGGIVSIFFDATTKKSLIVQGNGDYGSNLPQQFAPCFELGKNISDPVFSWIN